VIQEGRIRLHRGTPSKGSSLPGSLTTRIYYIQKYTGLTFPSADQSENFQYKPNTNQGIGLGATYHNFSLNLAFGFGFLNNNNDKGKSKGFGLQIHMYPHKWTADIVTAFNKGCYIDPQGYAAPSNSYYYRPDVKLDLAGLAVYRVPNGDKFSYHATMTQNEWQKKSAGSLLFGGQAYYTKIKGDSNLVPVKVAASFSQSIANNIHVFGFGPGIGYAYTLVAAKRIFIMGSVIGNLNLNFSGESSTDSSGVSSSVSRTSVNPGGIFKAAIGYNGALWNISANWTGLLVDFPSASSEENFKIPAGNFRIILARRFTLKKHGT
jgi:hypothetical protein